MNGILQSASRFIEQIKNREDEINASNIEMIIFPPFTLLSYFSDNLSNTKILVGSQDVSQYHAGAFTGEISVEMLEDLMCKYVIVGHSERRSIYKETPFLVQSKYVTSMRSKLKPILCIGETLEEKNSMQTFSVLERQLGELLKILKNNSDYLKEIIIAYEPFWSVGTGIQPNYDEICAVAKFIRSKIADSSQISKNRVKILYGGSVNKENVRNIPVYPIINGLLVGKCSLVADQLLDIAIAFNKRCILSSRMSI